MKTPMHDAKKRAVITRLRTGCWTCRRRGYRCDEGKPTCMMCRRLEIPCEGYGVRLKWQHARSTAPGHSRATTRGRCGPDTNAKGVKAPPNMEHASQIMSGLVGAESAMLSFPISVLPVRNKTDIFLLQHYFFTVSSLLSSTPDRTINTYISTILPLSFTDNCLLDIVLALSAIHISFRYPENFSVYGARRKGAGIRALIHRLADHRERPWNVTVLAAIIMFGILEVFEADANLWSRHLEGAGSLVAEYIGDQGSRYVSPIACQDSFTLRKLLEIYAYHEVLASIALRRAPRLPASFLKARQSLPGRQHLLGYIAESSCPDVRAVSGAVAGDGVDEVYAQWSAFADGPERKTVFLSAVDSLLSLVAELASIRSSTYSTIEESQDRASRAVERLRRWRCPDDQYSIETRNTAEAMRQAGILFYHLSSAGDPNWPRATHRDNFYNKQQLLNTATSEDEPMQAVKTIIDCISPISPRHSAVASHVWPLYMAGLCAAHAEQRLFIQQRLDEMISIRGMKSTIQVRETLWRTWHGVHFERLVEPGPVNGGLVLF